MADAQRIHPAADSRSKPTAPLIGPRSSLALEKGNPVQPRAPPGPPPRAVPLIFSSSPRTTSCCCRCFCWTISLIIVLLVLVGVAVGVIFFVFKPKLPQYSVDSLCDGPLPKFYQGHRNVTKLDVALTGQRASGSTIMSALQQQQQTGSIPLDLKVDAPVKIELGTWKLRKIRVLGKCSLVVDSLSTNSAISIKASNCKFSSKL